MVLKSNRIQIKSIFEYLFLCVPSRSSHPSLFSAIRQVMHEYCEELALVRRRQSEIHELGYNLSSIKEQAASNETSCYLQSERTAYAKYLVQRYVTTKPNHGGVEASSCDYHRNNVCPNRGGELC